MTPLVIIQALIALTISFFCGLLLVSLLWPPLLKIPAYARFSLAFPLGAGISSLTYFTTLAFAGSSLFYTVLGDIALLLVLFAFWFEWRRPSLALVDTVEITEDHGPPTKALTAIAVGLALINIFVVLYVMRLLPTSGQEYVMLYDVRAKFLLADGHAWKEGLSSVLSWSNAHQPLLMPSFIARGWKYAGVNTLFVPQMVSLLFAASCVGLLYWGLSTVRSHSQGLLGVCFLLCAPLFALQTGLMLGDLTLSCYLLASMVLLAVLDIASGVNTASSTNTISSTNTVRSIGTASSARQRARRQLSLLVGIAFGMAAWTKCEGLLAFGAFLGCRALIMRERGMYADYSRQTAWTIAGMAPCLALLAIFKINFLSVSGAATNMHAFLAQFFELGQKTVCIGAKSVTSAALGFLPLPLVLACRYMTRGDNDYVWAQTCLFTMLAVCALCMAISLGATALLALPNIASAMVCLWQNLFVQLWPTFLFFAFGTAKDVFSGALSLRQEASRS